MNITSSSYLAILSSFIALTAIIACQPTDTLLNKSPATEEWQDISDSGLPRIERVNLPSLNDENQIIPIESIEHTTDGMKVDTFHEAIANNKAKLTAIEQDQCPNLVSASVTSTIIKRKNEVMLDSYCDYYIYPQKGQKISVERQPYYITANLVSPVYYDFSNGDYLVSQTDEHVIRLSHEGIRYKSNPIDFDITVKVY